MRPLSWSEAAVELSLFLGSLYRPLGWWEPSSSLPLPPACLHCSFRPWPLVSDSHRRRQMKKPDFGCDSQMPIKQLEVLGIALASLMEWPGKRKRSRIRGSWAWPRKNPPMPKSILSARSMQEGLNAKDCIPLSGRFFLLLYHGFLFRKLANRASRSSWLTVTDPRSL